jgi:FkbM family methyltransferase
MDDGRRHRHEADIRPPDTPARMSTHSFTHGSLMAHPSVVAWRNRLRKNQVLRGLYRRWVERHDYEERFARGLLGAVKPGSVVWDIGANVGLYTQRFIECAAKHVVCFEPAPEAVATLRRQFGAGSTFEDRVRVVPVALARSSGTLRFAANGASPTNRITSDAGAPGKTIEVQVRAGDDVLHDYGLPAPHVIKIDVEGFELDVLEGLNGTVLAQPQLRAVFVEVHFALLNERGLDDAPAQICRLLGERGFAVRWLDPSHIGAVRASA